MCLCTETSTCRTERTRRQWNKTSRKGPVKCSMITSFSWDMQPQLSYTSSLSPPEKCVYRLMRASPSCQVRNQTRHEHLRNLTFVDVQSDGSYSNSNHAFRVIEKLDGFCVQGKVISVLKKKKKKHQRQVTNP